VGVVKAARVGEVIDPVSDLTRPVGHVALIVDHFYPKRLPAEAVINAKVACALLDRNYTVDVYCGADGIKPPHANQEGRLSVFPQPNWDIMRLIVLCRNISQRRVSRVIIMYDAGGYQLSKHVAFLPQMLAMVGYRGKVTVHFTNLTRPPFSSNVERLLGIIRKVRPAFGTRTGGLAVADNLVFYCQQHERDLTARLKLGNAVSALAAVPPTIDSRFDDEVMNRLRCTLKIPRDSFCIVYFGLIYPKKGIEYLLHASKSLIERGFAHRLLIIGGAGSISGNESWHRVCDEYYQQLRAISGELQLDAYCHWLGEVDDPELVNYFGLADLACLPFLDGVQANNSSFSSIAAQGLPVLTTLGTSTDAMFCEPNSGVSLVASGSSKEIAERIYLLSSDTPSLHAMRDQIKSFHNKYFSMGALTDALLGENRAEASV